MKKNEIEQHINEFSNTINPLDLNLKTFITETFLKRQKNELKFH